MAQVSIKSRWFEQHWRERLNLAAKLLRGFQERWLPSNDSFPSKEVVAVLLNVFAFDFHGADFITYDGIPADELWRRNLDEWLCSVGSPVSEGARLCSNRAASVIKELVDSCCAWLSGAAASWESNSPDDPSPEAVVQWMVDEIAVRGFARMHYGSTT
jgi:hypothetical protein